MSTPVTRVACLVLVLGGFACNPNLAPDSDLSEGVVRNPGPNETVNPPRDRIPAVPGLLPTGRTAPFVWGVNGHPARPSFAYGWEDDPERLRTQMRMITDLGFTHYRVDVPFGLDGVEHGWLTEVADVADEFGVTLLPVIAFDWSADIADLRKARSMGRAIGNTFVRHHGTRFPVVEIGNELDIRAMLGNFPGDQEDHYDPKIVDRYAAILTGIIQRIHAGAPGVRSIVDMTQSHTAFLYMLRDRKVPYDIVGWHAYVHESDDLDPPGSHGDYRASLARLEALGKDIWITEVNRRGGSAVDDSQLAEQASMLRRLAVEMYYSHPQVQAFIVYELYDETVALDTPEVGDDDETFYGLLHCAGPHDIARDCRGALERKPSYLELQVRARRDLPSNEPGPGSLPFQR